MQISQKQLIFISFDPASHFCVMGIYPLKLSIIHAHTLYIQYSRGHDGGQALVKRACLTVTC